MADLKLTEANLTIGTFLFEGDPNVADPISAEGEIQGVGGSITQSSTSPDIDVTTQDARVMKFKKSKTDPGSWGFTLFYNSSDPKHIRLKNLGTKGRAGQRDQFWTLARPTDVGKDPDLTTFAYLADYLGNANAFLTWAQFMPLYGVSPSGLDLNEAKYNATVAKLRAGTDWVKDGNEVNGENDPVNTDDVTEAGFNGILTGNDLVTEVKFNTIVNAIRTRGINGFVDDATTTSLTRRSLEAPDTDTDANGIARIEYNKANNIWQDIVAVPYEIEVSPGYVADFSRDGEVNGVLQATVSIRCTGEPQFKGVAESNISGSALRAFIEDDNTRQNQADLLAKINRMQNG